VWAPLQGSLVWSAGIANACSRGPHHLIKEQVQTPVAQVEVAQVLAQGRGREALQIFQVCRTSDRTNIEIIAVVERRDLEGGE
jgi:hypothetical protein